MQASSAPLFLHLHELGFQKKNVCRVNKLDIAEEKVNIAKGGTRAPAFLAMAPRGKVPFFLVRRG